MRSYISCCQLVALPSGLLTPHATPLFFSISDSEEMGARSSRNDGGLDPSVCTAIHSAVSESMGSLVDNLRLLNLGLAIFSVAIFRGKQLVR